MVTNKQTKVKHRLSVLAIYMVYKASCVLAIDITRKIMSNTLIICY